MARITLRQLLDTRLSMCYGVPAFNINNMSKLGDHGGRAATDSPVIIQASRGARAYANDIVLAKLIDALIELYPISRFACIKIMATAKQRASRRFNMVFIGDDGWLARGRCEDALLL